jgi:hypothetical protein
MNIIYFWLSPEKCKGNRHVVTSSEKKGRGENGKSLYTFEVKLIVKGLLKTV